MAGWISIERKLFEHWLWTSKEPFDKRSAWIDLIGLATHTTHVEEYRGNPVLRERGKIHCSMVWLAERWHWDRRKVKRFLMALADDGMLSFDSTTNGTYGGTVINLENYSFYQSKRTKDGTEDGTEDGTGHGTADGTYNNKGITRDNNNINNNNKKGGIRNPLPGFTLEEKLAAWRNEK